MSATEAEALLLRHWMDPGDAARDKSKNSRRAQPCKHRNGSRLYRNRPELPCLTCHHNGFTNSQIADVTGIDSTEVVRILDQARSVLTESTPDRAEKVLES
jgi:hypothetical protein